MREGTMKEQRNTISRRAVSIKVLLLTPNPQIQRQPPPPPNPPRQHQIHLQRPLAPALPQANRQPQDKPPRGLCADGPALPAHQSRERRPESRRQGLGGDVESGAGGEFLANYLPSLLLSSPLLSSPLPEFNLTKRCSLFLLTCARFSISTSRAGSSEELSRVWGWM
jgi:hypothetical protein